jgi:hypothetical protein
VWTGAATFVSERFRLPALIPMTFWAGFGLDYMVGLFLA